MSNEGYRIGRFSIDYMNFETSDLSVIVPAYNEEGRIESTLWEVRDALPNAEVIVVVNNSSDRTAEIVRNLLSDDHQLRLIDIPAQVGKGGAVRIGFGLATRPCVAFVDADGATTGHEIARLLPYLNECDCVAASRWLPGSMVTVRQSRLRRLLSRGFNAYVRALFGMRLSDTQCGAKLFRRSVLVEILDDVETADFAFDVDLLFAVHRRNFRIREVPTVWRERSGSKVEARKAVPQMFLSIVRLRLRHSFLRLLLPTFDRYFRLSPMRSRQSLRYLVFAAHDGRSAESSALERDMRLTFDAMASSARDIVWFPVNSQRWSTASPRWLAAMVAYLRWFRDDYDCVIEILSDAKPFLSPLYSLKPKVIVKTPGWQLPAMYSSALVVDGPASQRDLEEALLLAITRATKHLYVDREGHFVLGECVSHDAIREFLIARVAKSA